MNSYLRDVEGAFWSALWYGCLPKPLPDALLVRLRRARAPALQPLRVPAE